MKRDLVSSCIVFILLDYYVIAFSCVVLLFSLYSIHFCTIDSKKGLIHNGFDKIIKKKNGCHFVKFSGLDP